MEIVSRNVNKTYKIKKSLFKAYNIEVVKDFNYTIKQGEIIGLMGVARAGKSTIVNLLSGKIVPTSGKILVDNEENYKKLRDSCEIISDFKKRKLYSNESVYNNLLNFGAKFKMDPLMVEKNISVFRDVFELDKIINKKVCELNNLDLVKVNITISMLKNTPILFFDSALADLTVIETNFVLKMLKRLNKEYKTTIVVSSDDLGDIQKICKRVTVINDGKIIKDDSFDNLKDYLFGKKEISITFNKSYVTPKGEFEVLENNDYLLRIKIDFKKCDFASLINQFDVNTIVDINISNISLSEL